MKIHIVQKGDTLWKLAEKYGVDFEKLKQVNTHLADPDQLMPGMKVKIPVGPVPAKKKPPKDEVAPHPPVKEKPKVVPKPEVKPKVEVPIPEPKVEVPPKKDDHELLKALIKKAAPYVLKKLLQEEKPEVINQIKIELDMAHFNQLQQTHFNQLHQIQQQPLSLYHQPMHMVHYPPVHPVAIPPKAEPKKPMPTPPKKVPVEEVKPKPVKPKPKVKPEVLPPPAPKHEAFYPCPPFSPYLPSTMHMPPKWPHCGPAYHYPSMPYGMPQAPMPHMPYDMHGPGTYMPQHMTPAGYQAAPYGQFAASDQPMHRGGSLDQQTGQKREQGGEGQGDYTY
ncbi:morphogenetic protein associated with SpoVID [Caldalkalibacillus uzonensis]|uniref:Morphogenetic protein associated with SpoVID n=1 Tax=Caldalkalibacillus uzonensis TaxID=353224 RepID=A0ABU0CT34_9BACI|nr:SafA/ExsA family spore coat assembly protein [Caldalkalibacillus uzonensis]MDQ0339509.1 morphogenetic protein associated with SpoVID [Caldalkalibacillus uzonensis]